MDLPTTITIVVPVHNEAAILEQNIRTLQAFCEKTLQTYQWKLVIADNGSRDASGPIGRSLANALLKVEYRPLETAGKGAAIMSVWTENNPDIGLFIDADLAPSLDIIPRIITALEQGADIAIGSRTHPESQVHRTALRRIISHINNRIRRALFGATAHDTACGVKGVTKKVIERLIPLVRNQQWFFDTELLILAEREGYVIRELPVIWHDRASHEGGSKIKLITTSLEYLREMCKLKYRLIKHA